jgi:hypothetical protein
LTDFVGELRERNMTQHIAVNAHLAKTGKTPKTAIDGRTTRRPGYATSHASASGSQKASATSRQRRNFARQGTAER